MVFIIIYIYNNININRTINESKKKRSKKCSSNIKKILRRLRNVVGFGKCRSSRKEDSLDEVSHVMNEEKVNVEEIIIKEVDERILEEKIENKKENKVNVVEDRVEDVIPYIVVDKKEDIVFWLTNNNLTSKNTVDTVVKNVLKEIVEVKEKMNVNVEEVNSEQLIKYIFEEYIAFKMEKEVHFADIKLEKFVEHVMNEGVEVEKENKLDMEEERVENVMDIDEKKDIVFCLFNNNVTLKNTLKEGIVEELEEDEDVTFSLKEWDTQFEEELEKLMEEEIKMEMEEREMFVIEKEEKVIDNVIIIEEMKDMNIILKEEKKEEIMDDFDEVVDEVIEMEIKKECEMEVNELIIDDMIENEVELQRNLSTRIINIRSCFSITTHSIYMMPVVSCTASFPTLGNGGKTCDINRCKSMVEQRYFQNRVGQVNGTSLNAVISKHTVNEVEKEEVRYEENISSGSTIRLLYVYVARMRVCVCIC